MSQLLQLDVKSLLLNENREKCAREICFAKGKHSLGFQEYHLNNIQF